jgi:hypothetical protein
LSLFSHIFEQAATAWSFSMDLSFIIMGTQACMNVSWSLNCLGSGKVYSGRGKQKSAQLSRGRIARYKKLQERRNMQLLEGL